MDSDSSRTITPEQREAAHAWATQSVIEQLGKHASRDDIIFTLTQMTGESWPQAKAFVEEVEAQNHRGIAVRRAPVLLIIGVPTCALGLISTFLYLGEIRLLFQTADPAVSMFVLVLRILPYLIIRLAMVVGGGWGIWLALAEIWER